MTLTKAVEAARDGLVQARVWIDHRGALEIVNYALAALPDQPMSKDELSEIISKVWAEMAHEASRRMETLTAKDIIYLCIQTMKKANVLYVGE